MPRGQDGVIVLPQPGHVAQIAERDRSPVAARPKYFSHFYASSFALRYWGCCDRGADRAPSGLSGHAPVFVQPRLSTQHHNSENFAEKVVDTQVGSR
jgi:hypothetical protein